MQHTLSTHAIDPTTHQEPYRTFTTLLVKLSTHHTFSQTTYLLIFHHLTYPSIYLPIYLPIYLLTLYLLTPHPLALPIYPGTSAFVAQLTVAAATSTRAMELFKEGTSTLSMHILSMHSLTHPINISPTHSINPRSPHPINTPHPPPTPLSTVVLRVWRASNAPDALVDKMNPVETIEAISLRVQCMKRAIAGEQGPVPGPVPLANNNNNNNNLPTPISSPPGAVGNAHGGSMQSALNSSVSQSLTFLASSLSSPLRSSFNPSSSVNGGTRPYVNNNNNYHANGYPLTTTPNRMSLVSGTTHVAVQSGRVLTGDHINPVLTNLCSP